MVESVEKCLVEEKEATFIALGSPKIPLKRIGWFLRPYSRISNASPTEVPIFLSTCLLDSSWACEAIFKGWLNPQRKWKEWVDKLQPIYEYMWRSVGIFDAIQFSTYKIRKDMASIYGLVEYWSEETNTFIFPKFEATITLEDVKILGGFSVIGECVRKAEPLIEMWEEIHLKLSREHKDFYGRVSKKASHSAWMNHFMDRDGDDFEHIAFLSLWLSRYVFPKPPEDLVDRSVFPMAIQLSRGTRFALAPAILAAIYRDLRTIKELAFSHGSKKDFSITLWSPFQILQLWIWEHYLALRPRVSPNFVHYNEPRSARWNKLWAKTNLSLVKSVLMSLEDFHWRPYATRLDDWRFPSFYKDHGQWVDADEDDEIDSFVRCLIDSELVGLDCIEPYHPQRVSMQFGYDQDLVGCDSRVDDVCDWELAWWVYEMPHRSFIKLYIPSRLFDPNVTLNYYNWWKDNMMDSSDEEEDMQRESSSDNIVECPKHDDTEKNQRRNSRNKRSAKSGRVRHLTATIKAKAKTTKKQVKKEKSEENAGTDVESNIRVP